MSDGKVRVADLVGIVPGLKTERQETEQRIAELEAGMKWLRDYAIGGAIALHTAQHDGELSNERVEQIIGGIDGDIAVAMGRVKGQGEPHFEPPDLTDEQIMHAYKNRLEFLPDGTTRAAKGGDDEQW